MGFFLNLEVTRFPHQPVVFHAHCSISPNIFKFTQIFILQTKAINRLVCWEHRPRTYWCCDLLEWRSSEPETLWRSIWNRCGSEHSSCLKRTHTWERNQNRISQGEGKSAKAHHRLQCSHAGTCCFASWWTKISTLSNPFQKLWFHCLTCDKVFRHLKFS